MPRCIERGGLGVLRAGLLVLLALGCERASPPGAVRERMAQLNPADIVLVVVDTLRADCTTPYGSTHDTTPEIARWAERGVVFERNRSQSSWTKMSMASMLTSLWPRSHGITRTQDGLAESAVTLAEVLRNAGYATYGVQSNGWLHQSFGFHQGFDRYLFPNGGSPRALERSSVWPHADRVHDEAVRLIESIDRDRPFFLYLHFMDVHEYAAPPEFKTYGTDSKGAYLAAIRWVDDAIRRVREELERAGLLDQALLVFAADHGEAFGEHGVYGHARNVLTPVLWVPLVMRLPFPLDRPVRVAGQVRNLDIAPTLLDLVGLEIPETFEGESLVPVVTGREPDRDRTSFARLGVPLFSDASVQSSVNDGAWTYARNAEADDSREGRFQPVAPGAEILFDRRVDPGENVDLSHLEPEQAERMRRLLDEHLAHGEAGVRESSVRIDPGIAERLRAMGYLE